jgi:hypothetical protein
MTILPTPADGLRAFDLGPTVFLEIATWAKRKGVRVISRRVVHGPNPVVLVAYALEVAA